MTGVPAVIASRLRALSPRERSLVLLCAAAVALFALARWLVLPAVAEYRKVRDSLPARQATLARYRLATGGSEKIAAALSEAEGRLGEFERGLLPGESPAVAGANLQGLLKPMFDRPDTRVSSVRGLPPAAKGGYSEIAVQVDLQTSTEGLASFLSAVARSEKSLQVKKLSVNAGYYGGALGGRRETLTASFVVAGMSAAPVDRASAGARAGGEP